MYGEFDAISDAIARLHSPDFNMKKKETFDGFLLKFAATIAHLQLSGQLKILHLTRPITPRLELQTTKALYAHHLDLRPTITTVRFRLASILSRMQGFVWESRLQHRRIRKQ